MNMDLIGVTGVRVPRTRAELRLGPGDAPIGGGTWLYSEPQPGVTGVVDLLGLDWPDLEELPDGGLRVSATCPLAVLGRYPVDAARPATALFAPAVRALLGSWKIAERATVGGNICTALPAGPMTSLFAGLGATAVIWTADGGTHRERRLPVEAFVRGVRATALAPGEVLRAVEVSAEAMRGAAALRRISLTHLGRSAAFVVGQRLADGGLALTVTASVDRPRRIVFPGAVPDAATVARVLDHEIPSWYDDAHGAPDWRRAMTLRLAGQVRDELAGAGDGAGDSIGGAP